MLVVEDSPISPSNIVCYCDVGYNQPNFYLITSRSLVRWGYFSIGFINCKETLILHSAAHVYKASIC